MGTHTHALSSLERYGAFRAAATAAPRLLVIDDSIIAEDAGTAVSDHVGRGTYRFTLCLDADPLLGGDLAHSALLNAFTAQSTAPPREFAVQLPRRTPAVACQASAGPSLTQAAIEEVKAISGLTNEQVAPLLGVSRRSLQAWIAGEPISRGKEQRLLELRAALRALDAGDAAATYQRLIDQAPSCVQVYDLLAAGQFETAVDMATGRRRALPPRPDTPGGEDLAAQLSRLEDRVAIVEAPSTGRFSGRLRR